MISLRIEDQTFFEIPVVVYLPKQDYEVTLRLASYKKNSGDISFGMDVVNLTSAVYKMSYQSPFGSQFTYAVVLDKNILPRVDKYYGKIEVRDTQSGLLVEHLCQDVLIEVLDNPLHQPSKIVFDGKRQTYANLLELIYSRTFKIPFPVTKKPDGTEEYTLWDGPSIPISIKGSNGGPLPQGAYLKVYRVDKPQQEVLVWGRYTEMELFWTDNQGLPKVFPTVTEPLGQGQSSYTFIGGIPKGKYYAKVFYAGKEIATPIQFDFPNNSKCN